MTDLASGDTKARPSTLFLFPGQSRRARLPDLDRGLVPIDFFYGMPAAQAAGYQTVIGDTHRDPPGALSRAHLRWEILRNRISHFGLSRQRVAALAEEISRFDIALAFTDFFSLSLGLHADLLPRRPVLCGGFHGLTDLVAHAHPLWRPRYERLAARAVANLDHVFFFGDADRAEAIRRYGLDEERTSLFPFGVDTAFWSPDHLHGIRPASEHVLAVGSDHQRDFDTLAAAPTDVEVRILTRLNVTVPPERSNVRMLKGSFYQSAISDSELRGMYLDAMAVAVPLKDVNQPSGYSATLQAMSCGRPVVLSDFRGLWDRQIFRSGENCLLVRPGDRRGMAEAIDALKADPELRERIGASALDTARRHFSVERMNKGLIDLLERVWQDR